MKKNLYKGWRSRTGPRVTVNDRPLARRKDLRHHNPREFNWGFSGSASAQLALAICAHEFGDPIAAKIYQRFKVDMLVGLGDSWEISSKELRDYLDKIIVEAAMRANLGTVEGGVR